MDNEKEERTTNEINQSPRPIFAEIISIGDEITSGALVDSNSAFLSRELMNIGIPVLYHTTVGDRLNEMMEVFRNAFRRSDLVIITGGLGPTEDDLTRQAVAGGVGVELVQDKASMDYIRHLFSIRGRVMAKSNEIQSFFPEGAEVIPNPHGTAPGFKLTVDRGRLGGEGDSLVMAYPGVPAELKEMWDGFGRKIASDWAFERTGKKHHLQTLSIHCFGEGESNIEEKLPHLIDRHHVPRVGITASGGVITLRIQAEGDNVSECRSQIETTRQIIYDALGDLVFGEGNQTLPLVTANLLLQAKKKVAVLEWGTKGFLAQMVPPNVFAGGMVDSGDGSICRILGLPGDATYETVMRRYQSDVGADAVLAVGAFPAEDEITFPEAVFVPVCALLGKEFSEAKFAYGLHPSIINNVFANRAFNLLRKMLS